MLNFFQNLFSTDFMPHVYCLRLPGLIGLDAASDGVIAVSYFLIPLGLLRLVQKRRDLVFHWLFLLFAAFILSCGATHVLGIITLWWPVYRLDALTKIITAATSLPTALILMTLIPKIASLPSPNQWQQANEELVDLNTELERRVEERTRELELKNAKLRELTTAWDLSHGMIRNLDGRITFWCEGSQQMYGWNKEEAVGRISHDILKTQFPTPLAEIESELREKGSWQGELVHFTKSGSTLAIATHWVMQRGNDGTGDSVIEVSNDITDRLRADETALHLAAIVESSNDAIISTTLPGKITSWNTAAEQMFGYTASEMLGQSVDDLIPSARAASDKSEADKLSQVVRQETVLKNKSGREIPAALTISPIRNSHGILIGRSKILRDISERKMREEAVRLSEERQRLAMEAGQVGLWYLDLETGRPIWTQLCKELHGLAADSEVPAYPEMLGLLHPDDRDRLMRAVEGVQNGREDFAIQYRAKGLDYRTKWLQVIGRGQYQAEGKLKAIHGSVIDLTERKETEDKLRRANTELEQFAYAAAHDLQEPLRNVALSAAILKGANGFQSRLTDDQLLTSVIDNARRMEAMVKDLLRYSRALDGVEEPVVQVDSKKVLQRVLDNLASSIVEKQAHITSDDLPPVFIQETHLLQILQNLISNALKYGGPEPLRVHIGFESWRDETMLYVSDNGLGIDPQFHDRAFGMFKRLHEGKVTGTGIGLAMCKRIVEHYGGRIWIKSEVGKGATFLFTIPLIDSHFNESHES